MRLGLAAALALCCAGLLGLPAAAQAPKSWAQTKCERYAAAWSTLASRRGKAGLGPDFLARHDAFIASGCASQPDVCPRSAAELDVANSMVIAAMNGGAASTFPPFRCAR